MCEKLPTYWRGLYSAAYFPYILELLRRFVALIFRASGTVTL